MSFCSVHEKKHYWLSKRKFFFCKSLHSLPIVFPANIAEPFVTEIAKLCVSVVAIIKPALVTHLRSFLYALFALHAKHIGLRRV
jgi:hypothetical protein